MLLLLLGFEKLIGLSFGQYKADTRYIRLRENLPLQNLKLTLNDAELEFTENIENKTYVFATDENGFIQPSLIHKNADLTLAFIGGSTTECMMVDEAKRFPHLTAELLSNEQFKVNSINAGVSGNDSLNSINAYLNKVIPFKPDVAILMHNVNDLSTLLHEGSYWNTNDYRSPIVYDDKSLKAFIKTKFPNIFELLYRVKSKYSGPVDEFAHDRGKTKSINAERIYSLFEENLEMFVSISKAKNIQPVLMTQASRFTETPDQIILNKFKALESLGINYAEFKKLYDGMNNRIRKVAAKNNLILIDLAKKIPQSKEYMIDSVHFNNRGSELVAKLILEQLTGIAVKNTNN